MSDLTEAERVERAERAARALDEFLVPAFETARQAYTARMLEIASKAPWDAPKITALANAARIVDEVENQIVGAVYDGDHAKQGLIRADRIEQLTPAKRRLLGIAPF